MLGHVFIYYIAHLREIHVVDGRRKQPYTIIATHN